MTTDNAILNFLNLNFGMFIHFNMSTFHDGEQWAKPFHDPKSFAPTNLDCKQWAKAAKSARMEYAILTTKHHDGFSLWDTSVSEYNVSNSSYNGDIVKEFVDAFRNEGIKIGIYFSIWDRHHNICHDNITSEKIDHMKIQLTELLTNYGDIICIIMDGWGSVWGEGPDFLELPYNTIYDHIKSIQPDCLVINHSCRADNNFSEIIHYEATHGQHCPYDNTYPSQQGPTLQPTWFFEEGYQNSVLRDVNSYIGELNFCINHNCNYLLNAAPNKEGLIDQNVLNHLSQIGKSWVKPNPKSALDPIVKPQRNVLVTASSISDEIKYKASNVIECNLFNSWEASIEDRNASIELDFNKQETFNTVTIHGGYDKSIQSFVIEAYIDNKWQEVLKGGVLTFGYNGYFDDVCAQKFRLRVLESIAPPYITEITFVKY